MARILVVMLLLLGVVTAQELDPFVVLENAIQKEAGLQLRGRVQDTQNFPPRQQSTQTRAEMPAPPPIAPALLRQNYRLVTQRGGKIAGRATWKISLQPFNVQAPSFAFWLDAEWGVRLAQEESDGAGTVTNRAVFVRLDGAPSARATPRQPVRLQARPKLERALAQALPGLVLPEGFRVVNAKRRGVQEEEPQPERDRLELTLSNGLSVLVVTFAPKVVPAGEKLVVRKLKRGAVWVLGNFAPSTLERIVQDLPEDLDIQQALRLLTNP